MNAKQKKTLVRIIVTAVIFAVLSVLKYTGKADEIMPSVAVVLMFLVPYAVIGFDVIIKAAKRGNYWRKPCRVVCGSGWTTAINGRPGKTRAITYCEQRRFLRSSWSAVFSPMGRRRGS